MFFSFSFSNFWTKRPANQLSGSTASSTQSKESTTKWQSSRWRPGTIFFAILFTIFNKFCHFLPKCYQWCYKFCHFCTKVSYFYQNLPYVYCIFSKYCHFLPDVSNGVINFAISVPKCPISTKLYHFSTASLANSAISVLVTFLRLDNLPL